MSFFDYFLKHIFLQQGKFVTNPHKTYAKKS